MLEELRVSISLLSEGLGGRHFSNKLGEEGGVVKRVHWRGGTGVTSLDAASVGLSSP